MSKAHRGKGIRTLANHGRGKCPVCKKDGVKILYEMEIDGEKKNICKMCKATLANAAAVKAKKEAAASAAADTAPASV
jgi:hypothetical protein